MTKTNFEANQDFTERYAQMRGKASLLEVVEVFSRTHIPLAILWVQIHKGTKHAKSS